MKELLENIKSLTKEYMHGEKGYSLKGLKTLKKGLVPDRYVDPIIVFIPIREELTDFRSGGQYRVNRFVNIEIGTRLSKQDMTSDYVQTLSNAFLEMFYDEDYPDNYQFINRDGNQTVFSLTPGTINYETQEKESGKWLKMSSIEMVFSCRETLPKRNLVKTLDDTNLKNIGSHVSNLLSTSQDLKYIKFFYSHSVPPIMIGTGVVCTVQEAQDERTKLQTGRDMPIGLIDVTVWTKAAPFEKTLEQNLDSTEDVKNVLLSDPFMGGKCYNSNVEFVTYGIDFQSHLYVSTIRLVVEGTNKLPSYS